MRGCLPTEHGIVMPRFVWKYHSRGNTYPFTLKTSDYCKVKLKRKGKKSDISFHKLKLVHCEVFGEVKKSFVGLLRSCQLLLL